MVAKPLAAVVVRREPLVLEHRAPRAVEHDDALGEALTQARLGTALGHGGHATILPLKPENPRDCGGLPCDGASATPRRRGTRPRSSRSGHPDRSARRTHGSAGRRTSRRATKAARRSRVHLLSTTRLDASNVA